MISLPFKSSGCLYTMLGQYIGETHDFEGQESEKTGSSISSSFIGMISLSFKSLGYMYTMLGQYIGETLGKKRRRREEKEDFEGQESEETGRKRIKEEKEPLKMENGRPPWTYVEKNLFNELMRDFRNGALDSVLSNNSFANGVNYWDEALWVNLAREYNQKAAARSFHLPTREPYELILWGEKVRSEFCKERSNKRISPILGQIFSPGRDCQCNRIPVFPVSLLMKLGCTQVEYRNRSISTTYSGDRAASAGSGAGSGAGSAGHPVIDVSGAGSGGHDESQQMIFLICDLEQKGLLTSDEVAALINLTDIWIKGQSAWVRFVLDTNYIDQQKARVLRSCLHL